MEEENVVANVVNEQQVEDNLSPNRIEELHKTIEGLNQELVTYEYYVGNRSLLDKFLQFMNLKLRWKGEYAIDIYDLFSSLKTKSDALKKENKEEFGLSPFYMEKILGYLSSHEEVGVSYAKTMTEMFQAFSSQRSTYLAKFQALNLALEELRSLTSNQDNDSIN